MENHHSHPGYHRMARALQERKGLAFVAVTVKNLINKKCEALLFTLFNKILPGNFECNTSYLKIIKSNNFELFCEKIIFQ